MRHLITLAIALLAVAAAQPLPERALYLGTVGGLTVQLELAVADGALTGWYRYDRTGGTLELSGSYDHTLEVAFEERSDGVVTGSWRGELSAEPDLKEIVLAGVWSSPDGRTLPFRLVRVAEFSDLTLAQGRIDAHRTLPFFIAEALQPFNAPLHDPALDEIAAFFEDGRTSLVQGELWHGWSLDERTDIASVDARFLSARSSVWSYTGGAHGNLVYRAFNYEVVDRGVREVLLADLFTPGGGYLEAISEWVLADLAEQGANDVVDGFLTELTLDDLATYTLSAEGLTFAFAPYAVGYYAQGSFFVTLPLEALAPYAADGGPLARLLAGR